jgi:hypothetical protein
MVKSYKFIKFSKSKPTKIIPDNVTKLPITPYEGRLKEHKNMNCCS